jgi:UDP-N-acetylglucosamine 2-epimerase (non-hydrolysing)
VIFGTRPEAIKMAPVVAELQNCPQEFQTCVVATAQHRSMLDQVLDVFQIKPDHDLEIMRPNQSLAEITVRALAGLDRILQSERPDLVLVQGDTTTCLAGSLAAFYRQIPLGHVEAGLRTHDKNSPFPEEVNRLLVDLVADLCFAPTLRAKKALLAMGTPESRIFLTGNTVIDALQMVVEQHRFRPCSFRQIEFGNSHKSVLVTTHRRESFGRPLENVCRALRELLMARENLQVVFPVHLNLNVRKTVWSILGDVERAYLIDPLDYVDFVNLMRCVDLILTDSGGLQEEAPALGKPVLVIRNKTERREGIEAGTARLVGTQVDAIVAAVSQLVDDPAEYGRMKHVANPYGDGHAAKRVVDCIRYFFGMTTRRPVSFQPCLNVSGGDAMIARQESEISGDGTSVRGSDGSQVEEQPSLGT